MKNKVIIKGIVFDLGGVFVKPFGKEFLEYSSDKLKAPKNKLAAIIQKEEPALQRGEITSIEFWHKVCEKLKIKCPSDKVLQALWVVPYKKHAQIKRETLYFAKNLKKHYKIAVLSNTIKDHSQINRKRKIFGYFDKVLLSDEVGLRKPERAFYKKAADQLGLPLKNLLFVDDEIRWVKAARKLGLNTILFRNRRQLETVLKRNGVTY